MSTVKRELTDVQKNVLERMIRVCAHIKDNPLVMANYQTRSLPLHQWMYPQDSRHIMPLIMIMQKSKAKTIDVAQAIVHALDNDLLAVSHNGVGNIHDAQEIQVFLDKVVRERSENMTGGAFVGGIWIRDKEVMESRTSGKKAYAIPAMFNIDEDEVETLSDNG